jgi:hypothetical protein
MHEDLPDHRRIVQRGDQTQPAPAVRARQDVKGKGSVHQRRPRPAARWTLLPGPPGPRTIGTAEAVGSRSTRPYATTCSRHRARAASTPWQRSRFVSGRGVSAESRSRNSSGSNTSSRVPSCQARFSSGPTRPSPRNRSRSCAKGGRKMYRQRRSSPARSFAPTHTLACRSNPSRCAWRGLRDITPSASASSPTRHTRRPRRLVLGREPTASQQSRDPRADPREDRRHVITRARRGVRLQTACLHRHVGLSGAGRPTLVWQC